MSAPCECETCDLLRTYGRVRSYGHIEKGDASERCIVCGRRERGLSYYVWLPGPIPVCGYEHGRILRAKGEADRALLASPVGSLASTEPLPPTSTF